ncbi:cytochrome c oxidase copper chaperone COX17 [Dermatophagoides pteronyssinus]|uniref:cytochrome c oxidase copper chaperone COX17 n=1 Tax=Dermatophagoides pteronyssinus TaxID=6956 RepID=UPI003F66463C
MPCDGESKQNSEKTATGEPAKPLKPCCACPETRKKRDECIIEKGEANCTEYIEAHKECLRKLGFNI